jgi:hypothetical protein
LKKSLKKKRAARPSAKNPAQKGNKEVIDGFLTGWSTIAAYLGQPVAVAQRWAKGGMPVERRGRSITASPDELSKWLGTESGAGGPVHVAQESDEDLSKELRRGLKEAKSVRRK